MRVREGEARVVHFQMMPCFRRLQIERHRFFVEQSRKRSLKRYDDIEADAQQAQADWLERNARYFDENRDDPADFQERAHEDGIAHYQLLEGMRENARLGVVADMFQSMEKTLRDWLAREVCHWHGGENVRGAIWREPVSSLLGLLDYVPWSTKNLINFRHLKVSVDQITAFSDTIEAFWNSIPAEICKDESVHWPKWFRDALQKDLKESPAPGAKI